MPSTPAQMVEKIDAAIEKIVVSGVAELAQGGKQYRATDIGELRDLRKYYDGLATSADNSASAMLARAVSGIPVRR